MRKNYSIAAVLYIFLPLCRLLIHDTSVTLALAGEISNYNKAVLQRINDIEKLDNSTKSILFNLIDTHIQNFKTKQAFAQ